jgi:hypothetical protein
VLDEPRALKIGKSSVSALRAMFSSLGVLQRTFGPVMLVAGNAAPSSRTVFHFQGGHPKRDKLLLKHY